MSERLERTLQQLLVPDSNVIKQATQDLKQLVNDPGFVSTSCQLLASSTHAQVRQYAALLLRRKFLKKKEWNSAQAEICQSIRDNLLQIMVNEPEKSVRKSLAQLIATIAKHDLPNNRWPALFQFLQQYVLSENAEHREIGSFLLSTVASVAHSQLKPHMTSLLSLCSKMLHETVNYRVAFNTVQTLTHLVPSIDSDTQKLYESLIPKVVEVLQSLSATDQDMAAEALDILEELVECEVAILQPHIRSVLHFTMELARNTQMSDALRVKALSFIGSITRLKKKSVAKLNMIEPILGVLFPIICDAKADDEEEEETDAESHSPSACACQTLDTLALHLPADKFIPLLLKHVEPAMVSTESNLRRAAFISLAVSAEGCADHMRSKLLQGLLQQVYCGMADPSGDVRNAAMFALGQFSEHLQPDISKYSSELLPVLFDCMSKVSVEPSQRSRDVIRVYYAMESFCENLGKDILPYLPQLMEFLITAVDHAPKLEAKALAISAIGATANAAGDSVLPYFQRIIESLRHFLVATENEEQIKVQVQAIETLGVLARHLGENFRPLATECLQFGFSLVGETTEPDLKRTVYGLFGAISTLLKEEMSPYLEPIVKQLLATIESTEGFTAHYDDQDAQVLQIFSNGVENEDEDHDHEDETDDSDDEDGTLQGISVSNSFIYEKQDALVTLGELSFNTGLAFVPFMEDSCKRVTEMLFYPSADIRRASVAAITQLCRAIWRIPTADEVVRMAMLTTAVCKMIEMVKQDDDRQVATTVLDSLKELMDEIKGPVLECFKQPDVFIAVIKDVFQQKISSQDSENDGEIDDDQAEYDSILIESAGELIPPLAKLIGGQKFAPYFAGLLPELLKRLKKSSKVPEKSFAIGTIAETLQAIGDSTSHFVGPLYPVATSMVSEEDDEVRSNSIFCLGVLAANGGAQILPRYPDVLKLLFDALGKEANRRCIDNICAAVCRMITAHSDSVNIAQVFPVVLQCLPLKVDHEEHITVYRCVCGLYSSRHPEVMPRMPLLVSMAGDLLVSSPSTELKQLLSDLVLDISVNCPNVLTEALSLCGGPESVSSLQGCLQHQ